MIGSAVPEAWSRSTCISLRPRPFNVGPPGVINTSLQLPVGLDCRSRRKRFALLDGGTASPRPRQWVSVSLGHAKPSQRANRLFLAIPCRAAHFRIRLLPGEPTSTRTFGCPSGWQVSTPHRFSASSASHRTEVPSTSCTLTRAYGDGRRRRRSKPMRCCSLHPGMESACYEASPFGCTFGYHRGGTPCERAKRMMQRTTT